MTANVKQSQVLTRAEVAAVLGDLDRRCQRTKRAWPTRIVFRLTCCYGLRASEAARLRIQDIRLDAQFPHLWIPRRHSKTRTAREVLADWDAGSLADLGYYRALRLAQGAGPSDPLLVTGAGKCPHRNDIRRRFISACRALGAERCRHLTVHHGRHTAITHWLHAGFSLIQVMHAAGHASPGTTAVYAHLLVDVQRPRLGVFDPERLSAKSSAPQASA